MKRKFTKVPVTAGSKKSDPHDILLPSDDEFLKNIYTGHEKIYS